MFFFLFFFKFFCSLYAADSEFIRNSVYVERCKIINEIQIYKADVACENIAISISIILVLDMIHKYALTFIYLMRRSRNKKLELQFRI